MANSIKAIYDVTIFSKDVAKATAFYERLGLTKGHHKDGLTVFAVGNVELAIHKELSVDDLLPTGAAGRGTVAISLVVGNVDAIMNKLTMDGITFVGPKPIHAGFSGIVVRDPDGNTVNLFQEK
jgi:catechol 2,3-dioxygenase-like lactoylglutathione lyase family enzyme